MSEKKRKRRDEGGGRPSKKAAIAPQSGTLRVEFMEKNGAPGPVLAATPGLHYPAQILFKPYASRGHHPELLLQSSEHPRLDYTALEEKDGSSDSFLKDYIGVFDPATGKLQVVEVPKLTVRSTLRSETEEMREQIARMEAAKETMTARKHALAAEFGSKKSRKAIADITENAIMRSKAGDPNAGPKNEAVASAVLHGMADSTAVMPTKKELAAAVDSSKPRPQPNLAAEYPADVYTIDTIVGSELMRLIEIKDWVDATAQGMAVQVASKFVAKRILKLAQTKEFQKLKVLRYIQLCINFNAALKTKNSKGPRQIPPKDKLVSAMGPSTPGPVADAIRRKFASEANNMPRWHIDNLMTHIAAAALIVDNFEVDVNDIRDDLRLGNREIKQYFYELGCKVAPPTEAERAGLKISKAEAVNHTIAKLKLPLQFPKMKVGRTSRK
ncbi:DNA-directed RNA polymeras-like protein I 49 kDa polypeptide [Lojkania enalia]|uniref:DNA-directed RNA polymeras-like protein I 49 kDa polypeptide n=1 Tax=Lojkania enalia TaxID=147567 RepID=A0A9P4N6V7_9PLEO|nr:DNA-directed RNA polymeras-like protein I 49 kDa polypeptide [Didymosphaeria enalia]